VKDLRSFVADSQFVAIQAQRLFVLGHFIQNLDPLDQNNRSVKENLPEWFHAEDKDFLMRDYEEFLAE